MDEIPYGEAITIEQLLLHESGVGVLDSEDVFRDCLSRQELLQRLSANKPLFPPGTNSQYSNEGYFLLAAVIERVSGGPYDEFLQQEYLCAAEIGKFRNRLPRPAVGSQRVWQRGHSFGEAHARPLPFNEAALDGPGVGVRNRSRTFCAGCERSITIRNLIVSKLKYPYGWGKRKYSSRDLIEQSGQLEGFNSHMAFYPKDHIYAIVSEQYSVRILDEYSA